MVYALYGLLFLVGFLINLNGFLRGTSRVRIDAVLSVVLLGALITTFGLAGRKLGLIGIGVAYVAVVITRGGAARLASRLLGLSSGTCGKYVGSPSLTLQRISQRLARQDSPEQALATLLPPTKSDDDPLDALLDYCEAQPAIQAVMREFGVSRETLRELYDELIFGGGGQWACGHWVAASALAYPETLRYVLSRRGENLEETAIGVIMYFERVSP